MRQTLTIDKVNFNVRTSALLNYTPLIFVIKNKELKQGELKEVKYFGEESHKTLGGPRFSTYVDDNNVLWEIRLNKFANNYERLCQSFESSPFLIDANFNILDAGMVKVDFRSVLNWAHTKFVVPKKMQNRTNFSH